MGMTVLLTLGRLPKGLELARCLHAAGHRVLVADPFNLHLCRPSRAVAHCYRVPAPAWDARAYGSALLDIVSREQVDMVIPVSEEVMHVVSLQGRLPEATVLLCPPREALLRLHDKFEFQETVASAGLNAPPTALGNESSAMALMADSQTVVKARFGCSGAKLHFFEPGQVLPPELLTRDWVVQKRILGQEVCTQLFCHDGEVLGHVTYKGLIHSGTVAVCFEQIACPQVDAFLKTYIAKTHFSGFLAFDFILDEAGELWPLECNPRLTSGIHFFDHTDMARVLEGQRPDHPMRLKPQLRFQEGHTALTMAYGKLGRPSKFWQCLKTMARARDVLWSGKDPFVFPLMTAMSWPILQQVLFGGRSFGEAATVDIEWRADQDGNEATAEPTRQSRGEAA